jgi:ABC-type transporter Mla subunit MlaD
MSQKANYFKLGLFVIGAIIAGVIVLAIIGTGKFLRPRITMETYFNESVQGLDIGSKVKYRGVDIGEVTKIGFTYTKYELDKPMGERKRYVLVEAQLDPRLIGGKAASDIGSPQSTAMEVERGLRVRLAPLGITGTSYLEVDYIDPPPPQLTIDWVPDNIYIPSAPSTISSLVSGVAELIDKLRKLDLDKTIANVNRLITTANDRLAAVDTARLQRRFEVTLGKIDTALDDLEVKKLSAEARGLLAELRQSNAELKATLSSPSFKKLPDDADAALQRIRDLAGDPKLAESIEHLRSTLARLDRIFGSGEVDLTTTIDNLRQISDNLRDLTEDAKRYPSSLIFGAPPRPLERSP